MSESVLIVVAVIVVAIIVVAITVLGLAICVLAGLPCPHSRLQGHHRRSRPSNRRHRRGRPRSGGRDHHVRTTTVSAHRRIGGGERTSSASIVAKRWVVAVKAGNRRCAVDLRSSLDSHHPPRKRASTRKPAGKRWPDSRGELLGRGHPGTVQELVERRIHDVGDRVPAVLQHLHALLRARTYIGVQRHLLLPLTQGQRATGSVRRAAVESIPSRIGHARILHASINVLCMQVACMYARTLLQ